ncbi:MAG: VOC family protein [Anaerolineae bacterium]|nr:VOC family protein [Anaerolineae bacterium]NUQ05809.1 VOC family protein [Anaerolineae bacterium]
MMLKRANTILYCRRWAETVEFYRDILQLPIAFQNDWFVEFRLTDHAYLSVANTQRATIQSAEGHGITLSCQVSDIDSAHETFKQQGVAVTPIRQKWGGRLFYLHDPEGHRIELWQPLTS